MRLHAAAHCHYHKRHSCRYRNLPCLKQQAKANSTKDIMLSPGSGAKGCPIQAAQHPAYTKEKWVMHANIKLHSRMYAVTDFSE